METRKKRATELIEKCDVKVFSSAERTQVVQVYDRRVKIDFGESVLDDMSLYSILRSWVQDDPEKHRPEDVRARKLQRRRATINVQEEPIVTKKEIEVSKPPFAEPKEEDFDNLLSAHVRNFKQTRHRSMLLSATRYARSISSLDKKKIPRLLMMEKILMREQDEQSSSERSQEEYSSSSSVEDAGYGQS